MKKFYKPAQSMRGETVAYSFLGLAGVASLLLASVAMFDFVNGKRSILANLENPPASRAAAVCVTQPTNSNVAAETAAGRAKLPVRTADAGETRS